METTQKLLSKKLAIVCAGLWAISLCLPALVLFKNQEGLLFGLFILLMGWLGILGLNVAWLANVAWAIAISRLLSSRNSAYAPSLVAAALSFDTFRANGVPSGNGTSWVYGLGIGGVIWFIAILLTLIAASIRELELKTGFPPNTFSKQKLFALFKFAKSQGEIKTLAGSISLFVAFIGTTVFLSIYDRAIGNQDEFEKLNKDFVAFKYSSVCKITPQPSKKIVLNGPLHVVSPQYSKIIYPETLLKAGIPIVRDWPFDYYLENPNDPKSISKREPSGEPAAYLTIYYDSEPSQDTDPKWARTYKVKLVSNDDVIAFEQDYFRQYGSTTCPKLHSYSDKIDGLAKLVVDSVIIK